MRADDHRLLDVGRLGWAGDEHAEVARRAEGGVGVVQVGHDPVGGEEDGDVLGEFDTQEAGIEAARTVCRYRLKVLDRTAELQIKGRDGKVREADTFGNDPESSKG